MDPVPEPSELQWCVGEDFEAVTIGPNIVHLMFSAGGRVSSEYAIEHISPAGEVFRYEVQAGDGRPRWSSLLLKKVVRLLRSDDLSLQFDMEDGSAFRIFSQIGPYESGQIESPTGRFWVF